MADYAALFKHHLNDKGIKYRELKPGILSVSYTGKKLKSVEVLVGFNDNDNHVTYKCFSVGDFPKDLYEKALAVCNKANKKYRWVKFFIDDENTITVSGDLILDERTCGDDCEEMVHRVVGIVDDVYPEFMKTRWS